MSVKKWFCSSLKIPKFTVNFVIDQTNKTNLQACILSLLADVWYPSCSDRFVCFSPITTIYLILDALTRTTKKLKCFAFRAGTISHLTQWMKGVFWARVGVLWYSGETNLQFYFVTVKYKFLLSSILSNIYNNNKSLLVAKTSSLIRHTLMGAIDPITLVYHVEVTACWFAAAGWGDLLD